MFPSYCLAVPACQERLDFNFPWLCLYPTPTNTAKSVKETCGRICLPLALAQSRQVSPLEEKSGTDSTSLLWHPAPQLGDPGGLAVEGELSLALQVHLSAPVVLQDSTSRSRGTRVLLSIRGSCREVRGCLTDLHCCH